MKAAPVRGGFFDGWETMSKTKFQLFIGQQFKIVSNGKSELKIKFSSSFTASFLHKIQVAIDASTHQDILLLMSGDMVIWKTFETYSFNFTSAEEKLDFFNPSDFKMNEKNLRIAFTFLEYCCYFLVKVKNGYQFDVSYRPETETFSERLRVLKERAVIDRKMFEVINAIKSSRDIFCHSFVDIDDIAYKGTPLADSFENFKNDFFSVFDHLSVEYVKEQHKQVDWPRFDLVFNALESQ